MRLLYNARIHTLDQGQPLASTLVIDSKRILAVGGEDLLAGFNSVQRQDMGGRIILPGLTDAHIHLEKYALGLQKLDCETDSRAECLRRVAGHVQASRPGEWIQGHGWNQNYWQDAAGIWPSAADLDALAPENPAYLTAKSLHAAWANSAALRLAGIGATTPDPEGGKILRDADGQPTGILLEKAMKLVEDAIPAASVDAVADAIREVQPALWRMGLTGIHDFDKRTCFMALQQLHDYDELKLRVVKSIPLEELPQAVELGLRTGFGDDILRIGSVKVFADGALGTHTGAMFAPYVDDSQNCGMLIKDAEALFEHGRLAAESRLSLAVHAIGDRANHETLNGFARLRQHEREHGLPHLRHRIEHVQVIHPADAGRLAELDVIASMQPIHAPSDYLMADRYWGERTALAYAWRTQQRHGARLAFGSDAPVESPNPFWGLHAAVTRQRADGSPGADGWYPEQRLTLQEALEGFTVGPAYAAGMEKHLGRLASGFLADLIVLNNDPFTCHPAELLSMQPSATMIGGEWVWQC